MSKWYTLLELCTRYVKNEFVTQRLNSRMYKILPNEILILKVTDSFCRLDHNGMINIYDHNYMEFMKLYIH